MWVNWLMQCTPRSIRDSKSTCYMHLRAATLVTHLCCACWHLGKWETSGANWQTAIATAHSLASLARVYTRIQPAFSIVAWARIVPDHSRACKPLIGVLVALIMLAPIVLPHHPLASTSKVYVPVLALSPHSQALVGFAPVTRDACTWKRVCAYWDSIPRCLGLLCSYTHTLTNITQVLLLFYLIHHNYMV